MKAIMLNVHLFSTDPITWTTIILANFTYFERLKLRTIDGNFAPKIRKGIELVLFTQCCFKIMQHSHLEMIRL